MSDEAKPAEQPMQPMSVGRYVDDDTIVVDDLVCHVEERDDGGHLWCVHTNDEDANILIQGVFVHPRGTTASGMPVDQFEAMSRRIAVHVAFAAGAMLSQRTKVELDRWLAAKASGETTDPESMD